MDSRVLHMLNCKCGGIAHLVERLHGMQEVWGSIPHVSTRLKTLENY